MQRDPAGISRIQALDVLSVWLQFRCITFGLLLFGFRRVYRLAEFISRIPSKSTGHPMTRARRIAEKVAAVNKGYLLFGASCLEESLVLWQMLRRRGVDADFRLGARTIAGRFESHAWVEYRKEVLNDHADIAHVYVPIPLPWRQASL